MLAYIFKVFHLRPKGAGCPRMAISTGTCCTFSFWYNSRINLAYSRLRFLSAASGQEMTFSTSSYGLCWKVRFQNGLLESPFHKHNNFIVLNQVLGAVLVFPVETTTKPPTDSRQPEDTGTRGFDKYKSQTCEHKNMQYARAPKTSCKWNCK